MAAWISCGDRCALNATSATVAGRPKRRRISNAHRWLTFAKASRRPGVRISMGGDCSAIRSLQVGVRVGK